VELLKQKIENSHYCWPYIIISLVVVLSYAPTFTGEFILDDNPLIRNNTYITEPHSLVSYFEQEDGRVERENSRNEHTGYYRPFVNVTYRMDYKLWGMNPQGFRATNLLLHLLTCFFLFRFIVLLVNDREAAFWATLLFALHPVNTESVSWISARNNILVTLFFLMSLYCYIKAWEAQSCLHLTGSVLFFVFAVFSKEFGLLLLPCIFFYQRFLSGNKRNVSREIISYLPFLFIGFGYFVLRKMVTGSWLTPSEAGHLWERIYFAPYLIAWNLKLILLPYSLHNFIINYPTSYLNWQAFAGFCYITLLVVLTWKARKNKLVIFSIFSFHAALFPILNIIHTSAVTLISMRWLYFPLIFLSLAATQLIDNALSKNRFLSITLFSLALIYSGTYSYILNNNLWHDEDTFFRQEMLHFNNYFYAGGLAENLFNKKDYQEAERYFMIAIDHYPKDAKNHINYSALLTGTGRQEEAILLLERAKSLAMTRNERGQWHNNMGTACFDLNKYEDALKHFKKAVEFCSGEFQPWSNLGAVYGALGDYVNSVSALRKGQEVAPDSVQIKKNLALAYYRMGNYAQAISVLKKIPQQKWEEMGVNQLLDKARKGLESN